MTLWQKAMPHLICALKSPSIQIRELSASILGDIGDRSTVESLIDALETDDWQVRFAITEALGQIGDDRALPMIERMTQDINPRVCVMAMVVSKALSKP